MASKQQTLTTQANSLIGAFVEQWTEKYGRKPTINRFAKKWAFQDMIVDLGYEQASRVLEYYFEVKKPGHPIDYLLYNYETLYKRICEREEDDKKRSEIRRMTAARVAEWEELHGGP